MKTTAAIPTTPPLARGASPRIPGRTSDTRSAAYRSVRKVIEPLQKHGNICLRQMNAFEWFDSLRWATADEAITWCLGRNAVSKRAQFSYICVRPSAAVSRCVVQITLSSLIPSAPGFCKWFEPKEAGVGMWEDIKPLSAPIDKLLSSPVAHMEGNHWAWVMGLLK